MIIKFIQGLGKRENQEDFLIKPKDNSKIFVLCDGMGGHGHGEIASQTVAESVFKYLSELQKDRITPDDLQRGVNFALENLKQADIFNDDKKMGTTLVVVAINSNNILIGHIGDSRCYIFDERKNVIFRSKDHSLVQQAIDEEILTEDEAFIDPKRSIITRCLTSDLSEVEIEVDEITKICEKDSILICSDGIHDTLKDSSISEILASKGLNGLEEYCKSNANDNFSAILISGISITHDSPNGDEHTFSNPCPQTTISNFNPESEKKSLLKFKKTKINNRINNRDFILGIIIGLIVGVLLTLGTISLRDSISNLKKTKPSIQNPFIKSKKHVTYFENTESLFNRHHNY